MNKIGNIRKIASELLIWLSINLILPIILPVLFVILCSLIIKIDGEWYSFFQTLFDKGIYLFIGITLLFSLFQDYDKDIASTVFKPIIYFGIGLSLLLTVFLFISSMGIIESSEAVTLKENIRTNFICIIFSTLLSIYIKSKILILKLKKTYHYVG